MKKRKLSYRVENDEALVVAPVEWWEAIADHFESMAYEWPEGQESWLQAAEHVRDWVDKTRDTRSEDSHYA